MPDIMIYLYFICIISFIVMTTIRKKFYHLLPFYRYETKAQRILCDSLSCSLKFLYSLPLPQTIKAWQQVLCLVLMILVDTEIGEKDCAVS